MGAYADWQPRYAEAGLATFPVLIDGKTKKPAVSNYLKMGQPASDQLVLKMGEFDAFGFRLGRGATKITVLDVDSADDRIFADALGRHGATPVIVRSGSGNHQAWYRHGGEGRRIRPVRGLPVDILGGGYVVAPPSRGSFRPYEFIQGGLADVDRLPVMRAPPAAPAADLVSDLAGYDVPDGIRNCTVWRACMQHAANGGGLADLEAFAARFNRNCIPPLDPNELGKAVASARKITESGNNWFKRGNGVVTISQNAVDTLAASNPAAFALLGLLQRWHYDKPEFVLANAVVDKLGWTLPKFRSARDALAKADQIHCIHKGGRGPNDPPIYAWT